MRTGPPANRAGLAGLRAGNGGSGFTLIELLLVVVLLMVLAGALVFNVSTLQSGADLEEGGEQFETLARFARAQSAQTGRVLQMRFVEEPALDMEWPVATVRLYWEPDPLEQPGVFEESQEAGFLLDVLTNRVVIESVKILSPQFRVDMETTGVASVRTGGSQSGVKPTEQGRSANGEGLGADEGAFAPDEGGFFPPIHFYPDGSSDSAAIVLNARMGDDARRLLVQLIGMTGSSSRTWLAPQGATMKEEEKLPDENWMEGGGNGNGGRP